MLMAHVDTQGNQGDAHNCGQDTDNHNFSLKKEILNLSIFVSDYSILSVLCFLVSISSFKFL
jgi:hypothetical protein